ncbi:hypothetical protein ACFYQQ_24405 [Streptomyces sp. NPDC005496]|uniref:hypothetical protein n=1 Tax=unclassified Streptomyces TaxID=2593676 RepID=UPI0033A9C92D
MNDRTGVPGDRADRDDDYSATALASHWIQRPDHDEVPAGGDTLVEPPSGTEATRLDPGTRPDRVDGTLLRFGPGVTADTVRRAHVTLPAPSAAPGRPRRTWRRHALPVLVLLGVLAFLAWDRSAPPVAVRDVTVTAADPSPGCDGTADIVATVTTDGRPGTLTYRWIRSDGTSSPVLRETVTSGQKTARLHLLWTFRGSGRYTGRAELRLLSPEHHTIATHLTYRCP